ncbi:putative GCN5-like N-acetyltransferase [uncultured Desulfobacterium sp.]|uniref:Putative GCN5-like N-acetyltransferase n=1 Tax=uncultured Desulfobacterium sp. TaxID=201089 RepID=A0A445N2P9_9BACT|nr:putative GCN5-like N-acetyltransferase [uncultured Desulfobacterium sp.]
MDDCSHILPSGIIDAHGRTIKFLAYEESYYQGLREMYDTFEPKGVEAGLPPANEELRHKWIDMMLSSFFNIVAIHNEIVIGHAALDILVESGSPEYLIFIKKQFRYCGIGTRLSETIRRIAKDVGCKRLWLNVRTGNAIAIKVFKKVGFRFTGGIDIQREMELIFDRGKKSR